MDIEDFLSYLDGVKKVNGQWQARCPAHDDQNPSLSVGEEDGKILLHCHAGCSHKEILDVLGIKETQLFKQDNSLEDYRYKDIFDKDSSIKKPSSDKKKWKKLDINDIEARDIPKDSQAMEYLKKRGFSYSSVKHFDIKVNKDGNIVFPYYNKNKQLTFIKYRPPYKVTSDSDIPKSWREKGTKPIFWNKDKIDTSKPLVCVEGEMDCIALYESGVDNVTTVPSGSSDLDFLKHDYDWIDQFDEVIIWPDQDDAGLKLLDKLSTRIGRWRCSVVESEYNDANEHLYYEDEKSVRQAVNNAEDMVGGILRVSEIEEYDPRDEERIQSCIPPINEKTGGYGFGEVSVWTGMSGHGKSTFLLNEIANSINQEYPVLLYNGEYLDSKVRYWTELIFAGPANIGVDRSGIKKESYVKSKVQDHIRDWYSDYYYLYDTRKGDNIYEMLETFKYAVGRYNCKLFVVDNLMKAVFASRGGGNWDRYQLQSELVGMLVDFAKEFEVHVMLVAHAKKTEGVIKDKQDVSGHADITNRTDMVLSVRKIEETDDISDDKYLTHDDDGTIRILKNRPGGITGDRVIMKFDDETKRFSLSSEPRGHGLDRVYRWKDSFNN